MTPLGFAVTFLLVTAVTGLARRGAALGLIAAVCYITQGQQVVIGGFHFTAVRIVLLGGLIRILARGEFRALSFNRIDRSVIAYTGAMVLVYTFRLGTLDALVYQVGCGYDILLSYFVFRCLLSDLTDVQRFLRGMAILIVPFALLMLVEAGSGRNTLGIFGGIAYEEGSLVREGRVRCMESFRSPITAGSFGAGFMVLFASLLQMRDQRTLGFVGFAASTTIVVTSNSGGPLFAFLSGLAALLCWPLRTKMKIVRWGVVTILLIAQMLMNASVWYLLDRGGAFTGGHSWYRSFILDTFSKHFSDWWLMGTNNPGAWMPESWNSKENVDLTCQYVVAGIRGGLAALILFLTIIVRCFGNLGRSMEAARGHNATAEWSIWCIGAALYAHAINLLSVSYFDQMHVVWWGLVAMISSTTGNILMSGRVNQASGWESVPSPFEAHTANKRAGTPTVAR